jgi:hypothetical protein
MTDHSGRFAITPARDDDDRLLGAARPNDKAIDYDAEAGGAPASFGGHRYFSDSASRPETEAAESASLPPARYDAMCRAIDAAYEVDEVKDIRDKAIALEAYSKQARNKEAERRAREIRLRAERKAGKLLRAMKKAKGAAQPGIGRAGGTRSDGPTALRDLGISKEQSSNWQKLADVPEDEFEAALVDPTQTPSTIGIIRSAEEQNQLPRVSVAADALWLWARLLDFAFASAGGVARAGDGIPPGSGAIGHRDRHRRAPWRRHMPERRLRGDIAECGENVVHERQGETTEQHGTGRDRFVSAPFGKAGGGEQVRH